MESDDVCLADLGKMVKVWSKERCEMQWAETSATLKRATMSGQGICRETGDDQPRKAGHANANLDAKQATPMGMARKHWMQKVLQTWHGAAWTVRMRRMESVTLGCGRCSGSHTYHANDALVESRHCAAAASGCQSKHT